MPKIQIGCFTNQISCLKSWMKLRIWEPFVSYRTRALTFVFTEKRTFCFFRRKIIFSYVFWGKKKTYFFTFVFRKRKGKCILSLSSFPWREFSQRERVFSQEREKNFFFLNSGSFWIVLKLPETTPLISPINFFRSGQVSPLGHPNPTPTSPTCTRWVELAQSFIQVHSIPLLKVIHIGKWVMWLCKHTYNLGAINLCTC